MSDANDNSVFTSVQQGQEGLVTTEGGVTVIESLCMHCHKQGESRLLLVDIPHFRQIIIVSFTCPHCHARDSEIQFGGSFHEKRIRCTLHVKAGTNDCNRQVVKSDSATVILPELNFEIPAQTQKGSLNTIEGLLMKAADDLDAGQVLRRQIEPEVAAKLDEIISALKSYAACEKDFTLIVDDPAGNSYIQNWHAPKKDPQLEIKYLERNREENVALGLLAADDDEQEDEDGSNADKQAAGDKQDESAAPAAEPSRPEAHSSSANTIGSNLEIPHDLIPEEVDTFPSSCPSCHADGTVKMMITNIPHFKEVIIMAFMCEKCGYKNNEIKPGGSMSAKGKKIIFRCTMEDDMSRSVIKSASAGVIVPELDLELDSGTLGGCFTTVEGLLDKIETELKNVNLFSIGDSAGASKSSFQEFLERLENLKDGKTEFTLILDDPLANCHLQNIYAPDPDPNLMVEEYERTWEQDDELGLHDMNV